MSRYPLCSLSAYMDRYAESYASKLSKMTAPFPYLKIIYPDVYALEKSIAESYDHANFNLSRSNLRQRYHLLQQRFHPDALLRSNSNIQANHGTISHLVGESYFNLVDPIKRAEHWLCMYQTYSSHQGCTSCSLSCEKRSLIKPEFLEELFEMHEAMASGKASVANALISKKQDIINILPNIIREKDWDALAALLSKYRYLDTLTSSGSNL